MHCFPFICHVVSNDVWWPIWWYRTDIHLKSLANDNNLRTACIPDEVQTRSISKRGSDRGRFLRSYQGMRLVTFMTDSPVCNPQSALRISDSLCGCFEALTDESELSKMSGLGLDEPDLIPGHGGCFRRDCLVTESPFQPHNACPSVCPHASTRFPLDIFS